MEGRGKEEEGEGEASKEMKNRRRIKVYEICSEEASEDIGFPEP